MDNHKSELLETVETISKFAGTLAGKIVGRSREISDCVKNMMAAKLEPKPEPSTKASESIKSQAKKKIAEMEKEKVTTKQGKLKADTEKSKPSSSSQSCPKPKAGEKRSIAAKSQKHPPAVTKTKKSNVKPDGPTAKN